MTSYDTGKLNGGSSSSPGNGNGRQSPSRTTGLNLNRIPKHRTTYDVEFSDVDFSEMIKRVKRKNLKETESELGNSAISTAQLTLISDSTNVEVENITTESPHIYVPTNLENERK